MTGLTLILFMIAIGAVIGGITNHLAIKMLFKPHNAKYLFGKKVPFTPGLIPKRRVELADQMGKMVVGHLLTPEGIRRKLANDDFHKTVTSWVNNEAKRFINSEKTVTAFAADIGIENLDGKIETKLSEMIDYKMKEKVEQYRVLTVKEAIPAHLHGKIERSLPAASEFVIQKGIDYFQSDEGKQRLRRMIDDFLAERGMLGQMLQMFLGNTSVFEKVQPEVLKFLRNSETKRLLISLIEKEWKRIEDLKLGDLEEKFSLDELLSLSKQAILKEMAIKDRLNAPVSDYLLPYSEWITDDFIPKIVKLAVQYLQNHMEKMLEQLHLQEIVKEQVQSFSVSRLEEMVLGISRREFTMITYLGALLGGIIGGFQAIVVMLIR
ncbi:DUF445 family protein [Metabacillus idriensis]|uniref:DUF445 domain-containing protein n=1 Tax=Metabacillus idriensis TaxID=324768 RepID=UPI0015861746|nr:DUF445 family protein [Metabacillus idriensis]MCM3595410.1 DUF445 family protein [Metabacillus idriensis]